MLAGLEIRVVIPGHGEPFTSVAAALDRAAQRVSAFEADPLRMARHAMKALFAFALLDRQRMRADEVPAYVDRIGIYRDFNALFFRLSAGAFAAWLVKAVMEAGAVKQAEGWLAPA